MQIARTVTFIGQSRARKRKREEGAWHDITAATEELRVCLINMHEPSSARFLCISKAHTHPQIACYLPRSPALSLFPSLFLLLQLVKLYMFHFAGGHYSDGISEFLIISPVWQIAENSDESDFENFRSSLCRAKGFVAVAVGADTWNMCSSPSPRSRAERALSQHTDKAKAKANLAKILPCRACLPLRN